MYAILGSILLKIYRKLRWKENIYKKEAYNELQKQNKNRPTKPKIPHSRNTEVRKNCIFLLTHVNYTFSLHAHGLHNLYLPFHMTVILYKFQ